MTTRTEQRSTLRSAQGTAPRHKTELVDSTNLAGNGPAMRALIASDGYVFLRGVLDRRIVAAVGRTGQAHLRNAGWTAPALSGAGGFDVRAVKMRDAFADPGYRRILADAGFNSLPFVTPMGDVMAQLLGPLGFCYPFKLPRVVYPAAVVPRQPGSFVHKDYRAVQDMFTCWVPLGDVPRTLGGLAVKPGSQMTSRVHTRSLARLEPGWLTTDYEAGDLLIFHCLTTHAALPNLESQLRFSGEYRWQLADQPAPARLVVRPNGSEIGARRFSGLPWWRPVPRGLEPFDDGGPEARTVWPVPPSRFVSFDV